MQKNKCMILAGIADHEKSANAAKEGRTFPDFNYNGDLNVNPYNSW